MPAYARVALLMALIFCAGSQGLRAQGYYTLTNGHYYWFPGHESDPDDSKYLTGYDKANSWKPIYLLGTHVNENVTEIVEQGDKYLALDLTNPNAPTIQSINTNGGFNLYCIWYRTGNTGHYYQEWDGYRYYLYASHNEGLSIYKVAAGAPLEKEAIWYDWDHGAAIEEVTPIPGGKKRSDYWLIFDNLDDATGNPADNPVWRLSTVHCYQRPEEMIYENYRATTSGSNTWDNADNPDQGISYYDNVRVGDLRNYPAGVAATFMPVEKIEHPKVISSMTGGMGLSSVEANSATITYGETKEITANVRTTQNDDIAAYVTNEYTEYVEEISRKGINVNSSERTENTFGSAGIPTVRKWYYYNDNMHDDSPDALQTMAEIDSVRFTLDSRASRYLTLGTTTYNDIEVNNVNIHALDSMPDTYNLSAYLIDNGYTTSDNPYDYGEGWNIWTDKPGWIYFINEYRGRNHPYHITVTCRDIPMSVTTATITAHVFYNNGTMQQKTTTITVMPKDLSATATAKKAPVVKGSVYGGGRMANVGGSTSVMVHNTDSIYALYGGNDIAGWVQGENGATVQIGTRYTNEEHPIHIGWVYGGGCGYYHYGGVYSYNESPNTGTWNDNSELTQYLAANQFAFRGGVYDWNDPTKEVEAEGKFDYTPASDITTEDGTHIPAGKAGGTIPYVKTVKMNVGVPEVTGHTDALGHHAHEHNDYIVIDSLFGGAENAFVGVSATGGAEYATAIDLDINGGTILAAFGGNNYGGGVAQTSKVLVDVNCTKLIDEEDKEENSYFHGAGRDYGIRHVYGGGNIVTSTHAQVTFHGGMVDTAYIGGNMATVENPVGIMDCRRDGIAYDVHGVAQGETGFTKALQNGHFIYTNPTLGDTAHMAASQHGLLNGVDRPYVPDLGLYNVHFFFGGNNQADMDNVSFVQLLSGGVGAVLGGGNKGNMTNDKPILEAVADHMPYIDISPLVTTMNRVLSNSVLIAAPAKFGSVIAASENSQIIADYVHGGCRQANVKNSCGVYLAGGSYYDVFGGNDVSGDVGSEHDGATYAVITGDAVVHANVYGGNDGYYHCNRGDGHYSDNKMGYDQFNPEFDYDPYGVMVGLLLPTQKNSNVFVNGGLIKGDLVGGGVMANIGYSGNEDSPTLIKENGTERDMVGSLLRNGTVRLEVSGNAEIRGNVFGGGSFASIYGLSQVLVRETPTILGGLFAGNDALGQVNSFLPYQSVVDYTGCANAHDSLLAESLNQASQLSSNGDSLNYYTTTVDGIKQYNPRYSTYLRIEDSPIINSVYGSGNGAWNYSDDPTSPFPSLYVCAGQDGNRPDQASTFIDIHTSGGFIDTVFGGGAGSSVKEDVVVLLNTVTVDNLDYPGTTDLRALGLKGGTPVSEGSNNSHNFVGTIFGGNNFSSMGVVPEIQLVKGNVKNIYGGGNAGDMKGLKDFYDICGNVVKDVSTHVVSSSTYVTVTDSVFGGCRRSNIDGMAYVEVQNTSTDGIQYLYGGNDVSGNVNGNTRIDMSGGTVNRIWGGSNGRYDFVPVDYGLYHVYNFGAYDPAHPAQGLITTAGRPNVDSTNVNLWGGTLNSSIFTGGSMADCRATNLVVNDLVDCPGAGEVTINGAVYGGGEGRWDDLNARDYEGNRWGNVTGSTHVELHHAKEVASATAYGGGGGGDVQNTFIKTYENWDNAFLAMYGGCWGSDVYGATHLEFNGKDLVKNLFGGNDFTGNVYRSEIVVNSGNFFNVYGGGNGDYPDSYYTSQFNYEYLNTAYAYQHAREYAYAGNKSLSRPNTEYVHITFNNGTVDSCLYGGGRMGTVYPNKSDASGAYIYEMMDTTDNGIDDGDLPRFIRDTDRDKAHTIADPADFSYVVINIHGGDFHRNVFGGGRGYKTNKTPLVYGVKVVNMDGGEIYESLYGGSEFVHDGYPAECDVPRSGDTPISNPTLQQQLAATTRRPSSIVNITGGSIGANFYGTGYQGMVYGSSYVNIGPDAIDSCTVWRNKYGTADYDSTYLMFKPGYNGRLVRAAGDTLDIESQSDALKANKLTLYNSVYSGANWGLASGATVFSDPGFTGGESRLYIDGKGYNTSGSTHSSDPEMTIVRSIYGSGTSVMGGDIHSHIEIRNYGAMQYCHPTKTVETIQRADSVWMHNTAILLTGTTDASQQYLTNRYSMDNLGHLNYRGYNVTEFEATVANVGTLGFYEQGSGAVGSTTVHTTEQFDTVLVPLSHLNTQITDAACGEGLDICSKEYMVSPTTPAMRHTLLILSKGIDFAIGNTMTDGDGAVNGYGFVTAPGGYQSTITARPKMVIDGHTSPTTANNATDNTYAAFNSADGGFVTSCQDSNQTRALSSNTSHFNPDWTISSTVQPNDEVRYTNHATSDANGFIGNSYRVWKVGDKNGLRETEATLLAHTKPQMLEQDWSIDLTTGVAPNAQKRKTAIAEAVFTLPATSQGHYYKLTGSGFEMSGNNGQIVLVDSAWCPTNLTNNTIVGTNVDMSSAMSSIGNWYPTASAINPDNRGSWKEASGVEASEMEGPKYIRQNPQHTFGLVMVPNNNFGVENGHFMMPTTENITEDKSNLVISGNARVNNSSTFCSPITYTDGSSPEIKPSMRLYLTYDTTFSEVFIGTVNFTLMEYDQEGHEVAPVKVTVYIQTIIGEMKDVEENVVAMYNGGRSNTFTRKIQLPPVGEERNLYITGIKWLPTNTTTGNGEDINDGHMTSFTSADLFSLLGNPAKVLDKTDPNYPTQSGANHLSDPDHSSHNRFALTITPSNNVSGDMNTANGWIRGVGTTTNLYKLAYPSSDGSTPVKTLTWNSSTNEVDTITLRSTDNEQKGYFVGTLDGRGTAMLDVELTFDGGRIYDKIPGKGYVGKAVLTMESRLEEDGTSRGTFYITIYVKTREHGDTIYLASANSVTRQLDNNNTSVTVYPYDDKENNPHYDRTNPAVPVATFTKEEIGKSPSLYVQSFRKALEDGIYQEGDVIAIIDQVNISGSPVHITGPSGPPIEVMRYDGHHHDLPDEQSVYRGPMIVVSNGSTFTAGNIAFHGGSGAYIKKVVRVTPGDDNSNASLSGGNLQFVTTHSLTVGSQSYNFTSDKIPDTNMVSGPIIQVTGAGSTVNLREGSVIQHNWNGYGHLDTQTDANGMPVDTKQMGAISITDGGNVILTGNITVENNFGHTMTGLDDITSDSVAIQKAAGNGAIYVDGGTLELSESNRNTAVTITNNYLMNPAVHTPAGSSWWDVVVINEIPEHFILDPSKLTGWGKANVLLTRKQEPSATSHYDQVMNDSQSNVIVVSGFLGDHTKIGVRKWFPGINERDTIQFAVVKGGNHTLLANAVGKDNFISDDHFLVFYNSDVDLTTAYFFRCATFKHQWYVASGANQHLYVDPVEDKYGLQLAAHDVLHFGVKDNVCPMGGDSIIYRVQGGLMPYTFTWSDPNRVYTLQERTTPYSNAQVQYDLAGAPDENDQATLTGAARYAKYAASMADTLLLPFEPVTPTTDRLWNHLLVTATDATGKCELHKNIDLRILMDHNSTDPDSYMRYAEATVGDDTLFTSGTGTWQAEPAGTGWTDTTRTVKAIASRNFKGVQITPQVWVEREQGTISAAITGDDYVYQYVNETEHHELSDVSFCPGDEIYLYTKPGDLTPKPRFIMWDFAPYYNQLTRYIVPAHDATVTAYYGPTQYWHEHINTEALAGAALVEGYYYTRPAGANYAIAHNGDVHIYNEEGLAWLISVVNGLNGQQARTLRFNQVYIHDKDGGYDMKDYLWYPVGTEQHPFMGKLKGVGSGETSTADADVTIRNIILNEPSMKNVGMFGVMDSAQVVNMQLTGALVRGGQYVGALAGRSSNSQVSNSSVGGEREDHEFRSEEEPTTILSTHYVSGGVLGMSKNDIVKGSTITAKYVGNAVYSGGVIGYGTESEVYNNYIYNDNRMSGLYVGGLYGYGTNPEGFNNPDNPNTPVPNGSGNSNRRSFLGRLFHRKTVGEPSHVANNYVHLVTDGKNVHVGGLVGRGENINFENNYVYGEMNGMTTTSGIGVTFGQDAHADKNYYAKEDAKQAVENMTGNATLNDITTFAGEGNHVKLTAPVYGIDNLTRVLNKWVREQNAAGGQYKTWRSDLEGVNHGYPIFGQPDMIPVNNDIAIDGCDSIEWEGAVFTTDTVLTTHAIDYDEMIDSTSTLHFVIHHSTRVEYSDSATLGQDYAGYGFEVSGAATELLRTSALRYGHATVVCFDTLTSSTGCDSIVCLTLTLSLDSNTTEVIEEPVQMHVTRILVYPNPTTSQVTIEADGLSRVELYDNEGRRLQDFVAPNGSDRLTIDISAYAAGFYYLRIHNSDGVNIQKLVKK